MKLTLENRRFLIVWISINAFAFFVNIAQIEGDMSIDRPIKGEGYDLISHYHLFTTSDTSFNNKDFWPFVTFIKDNSHHGFILFEDNRNAADITIFNGVFNSYDYRAFITYILLGIAIVYVPKLWVNN